MYFFAIVLFEGLGYLSSWFVFYLLYLFILSFIFEYEIVLQTGVVPIGFISTSLLKHMSVNKPNSE